MDQDFEILAKALEAGETESTRAYFDFCARMHKYSAGNQDLIFWQCPEATTVMGYKAWTNAGYRVLSQKEGGKPILILAPVSFTKTRTKQVGGELVEVQDKAVWFKTCVVYDVSSIDQSEKKVPSFFTPLQGNADMLTAKLLEIAGEDGIKVRYGYIDIGTQGASTGGEIVLRPDLPSVNKWFVALHEFVHEKLDHVHRHHELSKLQRETQAEMTTFLVSSYFGVPSPLSADYLRTYGATKDTLKENLKVCRDLAHDLIEKMTEEYDLYADFKADPSVETGRKQYQRKTNHKSKRKK
jgi:hypothetical protein